MQNFFDRYRTGIVPEGVASWSAAAEDLAKKMGTLDIWKIPKFPTETIAANSTGISSLVKTTKDAALSKVTHVDFVGDEQLRYEEEASPATRILQEQFETRRNEALGVTDVNVIDPDKSLSGSEIREKILKPSAGLEERLMRHRTMHSLSKTIPAIALDRQKALVETEAKMHRLGIHGVLVPVSEANHEFFKHLADRASRKPDIVREELETIIDHIGYTNQDRSNEWRLINHFEDRELVAINAALEAIRHPEKTPLSLLRKNPSIRREFEQVIQNSLSGSTRYPELTDKLRDPGLAERAIRDIAAHEATVTLEKLRNKSVKRSTMEAIYAKAKARGDANFALAIREGIEAFDQLERKTAALKKTSGEFGSGETLKITKHSEPKPEIVKNVPPAGLFSRMADSLKTKAKKFFGF